MRAMYFEQFNGPIEIRDIEVPYPAPKSVLIKVEATGLCRSDWHGYAGHDSDIALPHVPGHELAGTIAQIGNQVKNFKIGDRVTVPFVNGCGNCQWCISGNAQVCPTQQFQRLNRENPSLAHLVCRYLANKTFQHSP